jgi:hypothetical protein
MRAFEEGHEGSRLVEGSREAAFQPASASDAETAAAHGVFGCPSRNCAVDGADCMMVQVRRARAGNVRETCEAVDLQYVARLTCDV